MDDSKPTYTITRRSTATDPVGPVSVRDAHYLACERFVGLTVTETPDVDGPVGATICELTGEIEAIAVCLRWAQESGYHALFGFDQVEKEIARLFDSDDDSANRVFESLRPDIRLSAEERLAMGISEPKEWSEQVEEHRRKIGRGKGKEIERSPETKEVAEAISEALSVGSANSLRRRAAALAQTAAEGRAIELALKTEEGQSRLERRMTSLEERVEALDRSMTTIRDTLLRLETLLQATPRPAMTVRPVRVEPVALESSREATPTTRVRGPRRIKE